MRLTFDYGYENYEDELNWPPRLEELQTTFQNAQMQDWESLSHEELFILMEQVEELMRYYAATNDFVGLEPVMRLQNRLFEYCPKDFDSVEILYLQMEFARLNAMLYRSQERYQQAATYYKEASSLADKCLRMLKPSGEFSNDQKLFVGWACAEIFNETAQCFEMLLETEKTGQYYKDTVAVLEWIEQFWTGASRIQDTAAEFYTTFGGYFYQHQSPELGKKCFEHAIYILEGLGDEEYWRARAIFAKGLYGVQEFVCLGNPNIMLICEREANSAISEMEVFSAQAMVRATLGIILVQKGIAFQQSNDLETAISMMRRSCEQLRQAQKVFENFKDARATAIASRASSTYVAAMEALGQLLFNTEQNEEAKEILTQTLAYLSGEKYIYSEVATIVVRAECMLCLMYIALFEKNLNQAIFYGEQVAQLTKDAAVKNSHPSIKESEVTACCGLSELYLGLKDKKKAYAYSVQGLEACAWVEKNNPSAPVLELKKALEKYNKKSQRKFF